ncbi:hypothetical protein BOTBODRAFT_176890 [Botryobasidium botryosum FD-172 SS1]|uniref:Uncharacterized protein n=1 Tax=Botryobasidium botryosum (strain FD-172 SS1) TaxID=930990 RepID=A0A067MJ61_BOTB1|nr:hypothetical protein BOTBODRAFT_176890 [Botryobasidium botryosum FD-172 SS1]
MSVEKGDVLKVPENMTRVKLRVEWSIQFCMGMITASRSDEYVMLVTENTTGPRNGDVIVFVQADRDIKQTACTFTVDDSYQWGRGGDYGDRFLVLHDKDREVPGWGFCRAVLDISDNYSGDHWISRAQGHVVTWSDWKDSSMNMNHMTPIEGARLHYGGSLIGNDYLHSF